MEGISLAGLRADSTTLKALSRAENLRILILDYVEMNRVVSGFHIPQLAMLSWRNAGGVSLPFALEIVKSASVLNISGSYELERMPTNLEARPHLTIVMQSNVVLAMHPRKPALDAFFELLLPYPAIKERDVPPVGKYEGSLTDGACRAHCR